MSCLERWALLKSSAISCGTVSTSSASIFQVSFKKKLDRTTTTATAVCPKLGMLVLLLVPAVMFLVLVAQAREQTPCA